MLPPMALPYGLARPFLFGLDPEQAHDLTLGTIARLQNTPAQCLWQQPRVADPVTVAEELRRADLLDGIGGRNALLTIQANTPASANAGHYARIVNELALLRRLIGDEAFFDGLRRFYDEGRFRKTSTDQLRTAMEAASGRPLDRFFDRWFYASALPSIALRHHTETNDGARTLVLRLDQTGDVFDLPVTVVLTFSDRAPETIAIPIADRTVERRIPLDGVLRGVDVSKDDGTLADVVVTRAGR